MKKYYQLIALILALVLFPLVCANAKGKVRIGGDVTVEEGTEVKDAVVTVRHFVFPPLFKMPPAFKPSNLLKSIYLAISELRT